MLKRRWIECTTYTRSEKFKAHFSDIPPVIAPAMKGPVVINSEAEKKSSFLKQHGKPNEGVFSLYCIYKLLYHNTIVLKL
jgi:hypothetical protein